MFAVVEIAKKQYIVRKGDILDIQKLKGDLKKVALDKVLLLADKDKVGIGAPYLKGAKVEAEIQGQKRGKKIIVYKYKRRKKYRKKQGHRQDYTTIKIIDILSDKSKQNKETAKKSTAKKVSTKKETKKKTVLKNTKPKKTAAKPKSKKA